MVTAEFHSEASAGMACLHPFRTPVRRDPPRESGQVAPMQDIIGGVTLVAHLAVGPFGRKGATIVQSGRSITCQLAEVGALRVIAANP